MNARDWKTYERRPLLTSPSWVELVQMSNRSRCLGNLLPEPAVESRISVEPPVSVINSRLQPESLCRGEEFWYEGA